MRALFTEITLLTTVGINDSPEIHKSFGLGKRIAIQGAVTQNSCLGFRPQNLRRSLAIDREGFHTYKSIKYWLVNGKDKDFGNVDKTAICRERITKLTEKSIIILDNAKYHYDYPDSLIIPTLLKKAKNYHKSHPPKTIIELEAEAAGHIVLFLPPYHPELSVIEYCWARIKRYIAQNAKYGIPKLCNEIIPESFCEVTSTMIDKTFAHVRYEERAYRDIIKKQLEDNNEMEAENDIIDYDDAPRNSDDIQFINDLDVVYEIYPDRDNDDGSESSNDDDLEGSFSPY